MEKIVEIFKNSLYFNFTTNNEEPLKYFKTLIETYENSIKELNQCWPSWKTDTPIIDNIYLINGKKCFVNSLENAFDSGIVWKARHLPIENKIGYLDDLTQITYIPDQYDYKFILITIEDNHLAVHSSVDKIYKIDKEYYINDIAGEKLYFNTYNSVIDHIKEKIISFGYDYSFLVYKKDNSIKIEFFETTSL
jgi:hypothetical protein